MVCRIIAVVTLALLFASCDMDPFLFNNKKIDEYSLSNAVIPDSARQFLSFRSQGKTIYGFFVGTKRPGNVRALR